VILRGILKNVIFWHKILEPVLLYILNQNNLNEKENAHSSILLIHFHAYMRSTKDKCQIHV
jgi:hypothetical protein